MNEKKLILYVEDMPQNVLLMGRILEAEGHQLVAASDGHSGWQKALEVKPDLILMDLHLPGEFSGLELTSRLKNHPELQHIPVVALTAFGHREVEKQALAAGCDGFLHKPADVHQIRQVVYTFLHDTVPNLYSERILQSFVTVY